MKIAIMQPYLFPYIGYFQLMSIVDKYVIYDDVNYIKGGWINRNNILLGGQKHMFTIRLEKPSPNKLINEILIKDDFCKILKTIQYSYHNAPYFKQVNFLLEKIFSFPERNLSVFTINSIHLLCEYLGIETEFVVSHTLKKKSSLKNQDKVINICEILKADTYINHIGGQNLYKKNNFSQHNINLKFLKTKSINYQQSIIEFIPSLSIIDVMMFNSPLEIQIILNQYELV
jgi:hypothetical protein